MLTLLFLLFLFVLGFFGGFFGGGVHLEDKLDERHHG